MDHYVPLDSVFDWTHPDHQRMAFNYRNICPMWAKDNTRKSNNMPADALRRLETIACALSINFGLHRGYFEKRLHELSEHASV